MVFAGYRFLFAGLLLLMMAVLTRRDIFTLSWKNLCQITILGLTQISIQYVFFYVGLDYTTG